MGDVLRVRCYVRRIQLAPGSHYTIKFETIDLTSYMLSGMYPSQFHLIKQLDANQEKPDLWCALFSISTASLKQQPQERLNAQVRKFYQVISYSIFSFSLSSYFTSL